MIVLERYILRRMLTFTLGASLVSLAIVWTVQALARINVVTDTGQSIFTFLKLASFLLPTVVPIILPFAVLIGITQTLTTMNTDSEMAVIAASGATRTVIYRPGLILGLGAALVILAVSHFVEPYSRQFVRGMIAESNSDLLSLAIKEGSFKRIENNVYVQISGKRSDGKIEGIFVSDSRDPEVDLIYYAKEALISKHGDESFLLMYDGEIHRQETKDGNLSIIRFTSYAFDLSALLPVAAGARIYPKDRTTAYLLNPPANDGLFRSLPQMYRGELHKRATQWTYPIVFALMALALAGTARSHRGSGLNVTFAAVSVALAIRWLGLYFEDMAEKHQAGSYGLYLVPLICCAALIWQMRRQRRLQLSSLSNRAGDWLSSISAPAKRRLQRLLPDLLRGPEAQP